MKGNCIMGGEFSDFLFFIQFRQGPRPLSEVDLIQKGVERDGVK